MRATLLFWAIVPFALGASLLDACSSGGVRTSPGDGGTTDGAVTASSTSASSSGGEAGTGCETIAAPDDPQAGASGGPRGCTTPSDCTVRFVGNPCCPRTAAAMTVGAASFFDEGHNGAGISCPLCGGIDCQDPPRPALLCTGGACALDTDAGH